MKCLHVMVNVALVVALVAGSQAAEPPSKQAAGRYRLVNGKGYTVCEAFLKNLNAFPASEPPMVCGPKIHPGFSQFSMPRWEEMDVQSNLKLVYSVESQLWRFTPVGTKPPPYEEWLSEFQQRVKSGEIKPRLSKTVLALNEKGPETLISYEPAVSECVIDWKSVAVGRYVFVLREPDTLEKISSLTPDNADILIFKGNPYFFSVIVDLENINGEPTPLWYLPLDRVSERLTHNGRYLRTELCAYHVDRATNR